MTDQCGVRWGEHACQYDNDGHLVGVDCECHCENTGSGYPYLYAGHRPDFAALTPSSLAYAAQRNYEHAIRFGVGG
jgi:hypothetical protein